MKANLKTTFDRCGKVVTGHIENIEMYEDVKSGKKWWRNGLYSQITHIRIPKEVFDRLIELDYKFEAYGKTRVQITEEQWKQAREHLKKRFESGERTNELYEAMMEVE